MSDVRVCVVKLNDAHGVEHRVKVRAESVYEAARIEPTGARGMGKRRFADRQCHGRGMGRADAALR